MKLTSTLRLLLLSVAVSSVTSQISPAPTYEITLSGCNFVADTTDIGTVTCTFDANGDSNHVVESVLKGPDCSADNTNAGLTRENDFTPNGESSTFAVSVSINKSALQEGDEFVAFCIQASVKAGGSDDVYARLGQKVQLDVATDGSFSFDTTPAVADTISAEADALDTTLTVGAYQCDDSGTSTSGPLSLGDTLYICIDGDQDTVVIDAVNNLQANKSGVTSLSIINDGSNVANDAITAVYDTGTNKAVVATKLPLAFFKSSEAVTVSGNADISAGGSGQPSNTEFTCPLGTITPGTVSNGGDCCEDANCVPDVVSFCRGLFCTTGISDIDCSNPCTDNTDCDTGAGEVCSSRSIEVCTDQTAPDTGTCVVDSKRRAARLLDVQNRRLGKGLGKERGWYDDSVEESAGGSGRQLSSIGKEVMSRPVVIVDQGADSAKFNLKVGVIPVSDPWGDEELWEDVKLKAMPNSAARVPQAFKISAAAVFAALVLFWW